MKPYLTAFASILALGMATAPLSSSHAADSPPEFGPAQPGRPALQTKFDVHLEGVSAVQLAWWFQHIADDNGRYWKALAPGMNAGIGWRINPREDAHQLIGSMFWVDEKAGVKSLTMDLQFQDYVTNRGWKPGQAQALNPTLAYPTDYEVPYPSPLALPGLGGLDPHSPVNGFNEQMIITDGQGFSPGRVFVSWKNTGADDTPANSGKPVGVDLTFTLYQPWMEGPNHPAGKPDGPYYKPDEVKIILNAWETNLKALTGKLPAWFNTDTQDGIARSKGWTVGSVIDTGIVEGETSKMWVWWWNHAMGDAPGATYSYWCPPAHYAIRWLPGFSPAEVLKSTKIPDDHVVPGIIYPDLQGGSLVQTGGGMMSFPPAMAPVPGRYKTLDPMMIVTKAQVDNFSKVRFPEPNGWLLHQWEDVPGGVIHRSTGLAKLPLASPVTQQGFYSEHQLMEGQFWGTQSMKKAYHAWLATQKPMAKGASRASAAKAAQAK